MRYLAVQQLMRPSLPPRRCLVKFKLMVWHETRDLWQPFWSDKEHVARPAWQEMLCTCGG